MNKSKTALYDKISNIALPVFTVAGFLLTALKLPQWGQASALCSQVFWLYSGYRAWRDANQIGIFVTAILINFILIGGLINYWLL